MDAVNGEGIDTHLDEKEDGAPQDERLVTEGAVLQQSDGVGAKHGEERVHRPHEEAEKTHGYAAAGVSQTTRRGSRSRR